MEGPWAEAKRQGLAKILPAVARALMPRFAVSAVGPELDTLARDHSGHVVVAKVDKDGRVLAIRRRVTHRDCRRHHVLGGRPLPSGAEPVLRFEHSGHTHSMTPEGPPSFGGTRRIRHPRVPRVPPVCTFGAGVWQLTQMSCRFVSGPGDMVRG